MRTSKEKQAAVYYFSLCLLVIWNTVFSSAIDSDIYIVMYVPLIVNIVMKNIYNIKWCMKVILYDESWGPSKEVL